MGDVRAAQLRRQIQFAAGLLPMPEQQPLHAEVFGRLEKKGYTVERQYCSKPCPALHSGRQLFIGLWAARETVSRGRFRRMGTGAYGRLENTNLASVPGALHQSGAAGVRWFFRTT